MPNHYTIHHPDPATAVPLIIHVPHASTHIPDHCQGDFILAPDTLQAEIDAMLDRDTDKVALAALQHGATVFVNNVCRLVLDPERFPDDKDETAAAHGMGAVYTHTHDGRRLRREDWTDADRTARMDEFYHPYHAAMAALVAELGERFRTDVHIIDLHSFPEEPHPYETSRGARPLYCLGYEQYREPQRWLAWWDEYVSSFRRANDPEDGTAYIAHNHPFSGSFVPQGVRTRDFQVHSMMIEINRWDLKRPEDRPSRSEWIFFGDPVPEFLAFACDELRAPRSSSDGISQRAARMIARQAVRETAAIHGSPESRISRLRRVESLGLKTARSRSFPPEFQTATMEGPFWIATLSEAGYPRSTAGFHSVVVHAVTGEVVFQGDLDGLN